MVDDEDMVVGVVGDEEECNDISNRRTQNRIATDTQLVLCVKTKLTIVPKRVREFLSPCLTTFDRRYSATPQKSRTTVGEGLS